MNSSPDCFVSGVLAVVLRASKYWCMAPLRFVKHKKGWWISLSPGLTMFGHFVMTIIGVLMLWTLIAEVQVDHTPQLQTRSRRLVWLLTTLVMTLTTGVMMYRAPRHMQRIIASLNDVQKINSKLNMHNWQMKWTATRVTLLTVFVAISMTIFVSDYYVYRISAVAVPEEKAWIKWSRLLYYVFFWKIELGLMQFVLIVLLTRSSFKAINEYLRKILEYDGKDFNQHSETVHAVGSAYAFACDVVSDVAGCYGLMLIFLLTSVFLQLITRPYYFIMNLFQSQLLHDPTLYSYEIMQLLWFTFHVFNLLLIIEPCYSTQTEMARTRDLVGRLMLRASSVYDPLSVALKQFSRQLALTEASYKPLDVTMLTRGLMLSIFANITTYLVVLVDTE